MRGAGDNSNAHDDSNLLGPRIAEYSSVLLYLYMSQPGKTLLLPSAVVRARLRTLFRSRIGCGTSDVLNLRILWHETRLIVARSGSLYKLRSSCSHWKSFPAAFILTSAIVSRELLSRIGDKFNFCKCSLFGGAWNDLCYYSTLQLMISFLMHHSITIIIYIEAITLARSDDRQTVNCINCSIILHFCSRVFY